MENHIWHHGGDLRQHRKILKNLLNDLLDDLIFDGEAFKMSIKKHKKWEKVRDS